MMSRSVSNNLEGKFKNMRAFSLFSIIVLTAGMALASGNSNNSNNGGDTTATSGSTAIAGGGTGGTGGAGGRADAELNAIVQQYGGSLKSETSVDASSRNTVVQGQDQKSTVVNAPVDVEIYEAENVAGAAKEARKGTERHAETAPNATGYTVGGQTPCGDVTGLSGQVGAGGAGLSTITEPCRQYRLMALEEIAKQTNDGRLPFRVRLAQFQYYVGFPGRLALNIASLGALN